MLPGSVSNVDVRPGIFGGLFHFVDIGLISGDDQLGHLVDVPDCSLFNTPPLTHSQCRACGLILDELFAPARYPVPESIRVVRTNRLRKSCYVL